MTTDPALSIEQTLERHGPMLRRLAASLLSDAGAADDLVQDTWMTALRRWPWRERAESPGRERSWLSSTMRRLAMNRYRDGARRRALDLDGSPEPLAGGMAADEVAAQLEAERLVHEALRTLPATFRTAVTLRHSEGATFAEIGRRLGLSESAARDRVNAGLDRMRTRLSQSFEGSESRGDWRLAQAPLVSVRVDRARTAAAGAASSSLGLFTWVQLVAVLAAVTMTSAALLVRPAETDEEPRAELAEVSVARLVPSEARASKTPSRSVAVPRGRTPASVEVPRNAPPADGYRSASHVLVVDGDGRPLPHFPVAAFVEKERPEEGDRDRLLGRGTTDANGRFPIPEELRFFPDEVVFTPADGSSRQVFGPFGLKLWVGRRDLFGEHQVIEAPELGAEEPVLVVKDTAHVRIDVLDAGGRPWIGRHRVQISAANKTERPRTSESRSVEQAETRFYVARGHPYRVLINELGEWRKVSQTFPAIELGEHELTHVLRVRDRRCVLVARIVDEDCEPRPNLKGDIAGCRFTTDDAGWARMPVAGDPAGLGGKSVEIDTSRYRGMYGPRTTFVLPDPVIAGDVHVGDIKIPVTPIFARGTLETPGGKPLAWRDLYFLRRKEDGGWTATGKRVMTDGEGRFSMLAPVEGEDLALDLTKPEVSFGTTYVLLVPVQFEPGDDAIELRTVSIAPDAVQRRPWWR